MALKNACKIIAVALFFIAIAVMLTGAFECQGLKTMEGLWAHSALGLFITAFVAGGLGQ